MKNSLIIFVLVLLGIACSSPQNDSTQQETQGHHDQESSTVELTDIQYEQAGIELGSIQQRNLSNVIKANGVIDIPPQNLVSISAPLGGFLRKTDLLQGMKVRKGQVLAIIENPDFIPMQQEYLEVISQLEYAELDLTRQRELSAEQVNAKKTYQQAQSLTKTLLARKLGLQERIKMAGLPLETIKKGNIVNHATLRAPISGSVTTVSVNIGMYVNPTDIMFQIVDTDHLHIELSVFEKDIAKVKLGQKVRFWLTNNPEKELAAEVYLINQMIDKDKTVRVHCHLEQDVKGLLPQNFVRATIETGDQKSPALPDQAVVNFEGKDYIFASSATKTSKAHAASESHGKEFEMIEIQKGISEDGYTQIDVPAGWDPSRQTVIKGAYTVLSVMKNTESGHHH